ncbi:lysylphosphatidylglycerol synthase domain-containing protein [Rhizobiaceae bacterium n13]|uniref:Lysylphosphatidylglycerol synthase domain-containing protein n=1 Tax=Ferirhizobium litorale TaxID=2927786 RepID=A0AAE3QH13_9HYPH|nr:lysylphosphatidylglycerol synthase domain-containing protein [Fererhizobium litorale]MDI7863221.1 lysylphosphatidylglycerol synthase domain-containing protein [Fererhizobium litorale]MDI7923044.1 lysylphosphatidylglycerol synthase domain-containing protein [Fererhizobium litorale]
MKSLSKYFWPVVGLLTITLSAWLLFMELRGLSVEDLADSLGAISFGNWLLCGLSTILAYAALAGYDRIALAHLGKRIDWLFITVCSFTAYALSHNVGASVFSGAVVRYRAYTSRGLTPTEVGILVTFCSFTFVLGTIFLAGLVLVFRPDVAERFVDILPGGFSASLGYLFLALVGLYIVGSRLGFKPLKIGFLQIPYPKPGIVARQLVIGPLELISAATIIYFALPAAGNPGFVVVLGIFLVSFSAALISHAPGGLGVLELVFLTGLSDMPAADVLAALLVFRLFYLLIPFVMALFVILLFELREWRKRRHGSGA